MRRIAGLVFVGLGVALIALAVALPAYVYPRVAKVPDNPNTVQVAEGTGITSLVPSLVVKGGNGILMNQTVVSTRSVIGVKPRNNVQVPKGQKFYQQAFDARVINPELKGNDGLLEANVEGVSWNEKTGRATNCCGDYLIEDQEHPEGKKITHDGQVFKFPFGVKQGQDYPFWDSNIEAATLARYDGTEKITAKGQSINTYRYVQAINDEVIGQQAVPGTLVGSDAASVTADRVYATVRTLWVEPYTGVIIKGQEQVNQRLAINGKEVPIIQGKLSFNDDTVAANIKEYKTSALGLRFVTKLGPIGGWILGPICALIGLTMLALSRRDRGEWEDDWDDDYDEDEYEDDEDDDADDDADTNHRSSV